MCTDLKTIQADVVTVYKVVALKRNRRKDICFSICNKMRYKIGKVPKVRKEKFLIYGWGSFLNPTDRWYNSDMVGKTSGFVRIKSATHLLHIVLRKQRNKSFEYKIAKFVLSGDVKQGIFHVDCVNFGVFAGNYIESIELI